MNYNYVIFATDYDLYKYTFQDAVQQCNAQFYCDVKDLMNPIEKILYRVCFNERLNQKINVPFKSYGIELFSIRYISRKINQFVSYGFGTFKI